MGTEEHVSDPLSASLVELEDLRSSPSGTKGVSDFEIGLDGPYVIICVCIHQRTTDSVYAVL